MNQIHNFSDDVVPLSNLDDEILSNVVAKPDQVEGFRDFGLMTLRAKHSISNSTEEKSGDFANTQFEKRISEASLIKSNSGGSIGRVDPPSVPRIRNGFTKIEMQMKKKAEQARRCVLNGH
jgi:hypothetical protein